LGLISKMLSSDTPIILFGISDFLKLHLIVAVTEEVMKAKISEILHERLKDKNLSQISRDLGISKSLLSDWVSSRRLPSLKNIDALAKLAAYLGITLEQLLLGKQSENKVISAVTFDDEQRRYKINIERVK